MQELNEKEKREIERMGILLRKTVIFILCVCLGIMASLWIQKTEITKVENTSGVVTYTGIEQIPKLSVFADEKQLSLGKDYIKKGDWLATECGEYSVTVKGINRYRGMKSIKWTIQQGDAVVNKVTYKDENTKVELVTPYVNGYILIEILNKDKKVIHQEQLDGIKQNGKGLKISIPGKLKSGKYCVKVTSASFSEYRNIKVETKYGKSVTISDFTVR